jgi:sensor histidine kinase YesM
MIIGDTIGYILFRGEEYTFAIFLLQSAYSIGIGYAFLAGARIIVIYLDRRVPWLRYPVKRLILQVTYLIILCFMVIGAFTLFIFVTSEASVQEVKSQSILGITISLTGIILGTIIANSVLFFNNWKKSAVQQEKLKSEHLALQYETLKSQVNPHFLFNSLNSLVSLIERDRENAISFVKKLSDVYRYVLDQRDHELVLLQDELEFVEAYIFLQKIRFGEKIQFSVSIGLPGNSKVIPLSLQMLVENAIKHNEVSNEQPLTIGITSSDDQCVVVRNNIRKKFTSERSTGVGIENIRKRYEYFTNKAVYVNEDAGYFTVKLPVILNQ